MGPLTIIYLLHNFHNSNSWIIRSPPPSFFFGGGPFSLELNKFDCIFLYILADRVFVPNWINSTNVGFCWSVTSGNFSVSAL